MLWRAAAAVLSVCAVGAITNNADLIWFAPGDEQPHPFKARQPVPEGMLGAERIVVRQRVPVLYEVKFTGFDRLQALEVDGCGVEEVRPGAFRDLKPLATLSLSSNSLREVAEGAFSPLHVHTLNLTRNRISVIHRRAFHQMAALHVLVLDFNELRQWDGGWFLNCSGLRTLSATHNFLEELPEAAFATLRDNAGVSIRLGYNKIRRVAPAALGGGPAVLGELCLDWNDLRELDADALLEAVNITSVLDLSGNFLECPQLADTTLARIQVLNVDNNPLNCTCKAALLAGGRAAGGSVVAPADCDVEGGDSPE